ncbi:peptidoglycan-binding domain-containing protein [Ruegeria sp. Ofav3-42]|uniref:peptidoglycan-binding domain-containing protein n=1 Tax=Ruegeria sp. Ofav3-42 TaxID=2917759 RepID=UPI001EF5BFFC|nr:peptidoglycan-binding domain-containing protein [Ruegeria sp. Ofav3-42]MCG7521925.1 peptidoglycan-binding protein [Ruegeria sp. Ofav3-42]
MRGWSRGKIARTVWFFVRGVFALVGIAVLPAAADTFGGSSIPRNAEIELPFEAHGLEAGPNGTILVLSDETRDIAVVGADGALVFQSTLAGDPVWITRQPPSTARGDIVILTKEATRRIAALHLELGPNGTLDQRVYPLFADDENQVPPSELRAIILPNALPLAGGGRFGGPPPMLFWGPGVGTSMLTDLQNRFAFGRLFGMGPDLLFDLGVTDEFERPQLLMMDAASQGLSVLNPFDLSIQDRVRFAGFEANSAKDFDYVTVPVEPSVNNLTGVGYRTVLADRVANQLSVLGLERDDFGVRVGAPSTLPLDDIARAGRLFVAATPNLSTIFVGSSGSRDVMAVKWLRGVFDTSADRTQRLEFETPFRDLVTLNQGASVSETFFAGLSSDGRFVRFWTTAELLDAGGRVAETSQPDPRQEYGDCVDQSLTLNPGEIASAQRALTLLGFSVGGIDGVVGENTRAALTEFQKVRGIPITGEVDCKTRSALSDADPSSVGVEFDAGVVAAFETYMKEAAGLSSARRLLTMGVSHQNPSHRCFGLNSMPPEALWPNAVRFAHILRKLEERYELDIQIVSGYRSPSYNTCVRASPESPNLQFLEFDIRLENAETYLKSALRIREALEDLEARNEASFITSSLLQGYSVEVKPELGAFHAQITSYPDTERGCRFARDDLNEMAEVLKDGPLSGRLLSVLRSGAAEREEGGAYVVTIDLHGDRSAAVEASQIVQALSAKTVDRSTGGDAYVVLGDRLRVTPSCNAVRVIP